MELIYVVEDDRSIQEIECFALSNSGYRTEGFRTAGEFYAALERELPDLVLLDIMLPDEDGLNLVKRLRAGEATVLIPILLVTARTTELDKVKGLDIGADDYMTKPFRPLELVARVKAQLRRYKHYNQPQAAEGQDSSLLVHGGLVMNVKTHECQLDEKPLVLTPTEFSILKILCQRKGEVVSSEELFHGVWKDEYYSKSNNTITVHIRHLREKMKDSVEHPKYIKTVWGVGYKIEN